MKALIMRCLLVVTLGLLLTLVVLLPGIKKPAPASAYSSPHSGKLAPMATFHLWKITEIFSCADGSIQFIEMFTSANFQEQLMGHTLEAAIQGTFGEVFTFPGDSGQPTTNRFLLLATSNFGSLSGGVTPDFIIPSNFLVIPDGPEGAIILFEIYDNIAYDVGELPLDGVQSLNKNFNNGNLTTATNSPRNFAGQQGSITCPPNLAITKKVPTTVVSGNRITYTLTVTSSGPTTNTTVILTDTIPSGTTFATADIQPVNNVLTWTLGILNPSTVVSRTFAVTVNLAAGSVVNNNYGVRSDQASATGTPVTTTVVAAQALLALNKKAPAITVPGSRITYTLTVTSSGNIANTNVVLTDTIPSGAIFASASELIQPVNNVLTWTLGTLNPSTVVSRTFAVTVNVPVGSNVVNNNYRVRSDQTSATGTPVTTTVVVPQAFLALTKKAPATTIPGGRITFTLIVTSSGSVANTNVILTDTIPASTTFASAQVQPVNGVLTWPLGTLNPLVVVSRTFVVTANAVSGTNIINAKYGVRSNQASAGGLPITVKVVAAQSLTYLPLILKDFVLPDEHDADLNSLPTEGN